MEDTKKIEQLCRKSVEAGIKQLCDIGTWPRPPVARRLRVGYDFYRDQLTEITEVNDLIEYLASDKEIQSIYFKSPSKPERYILYEYWEQLLLKILRETEGVSPRNGIFRKWFSRFLKELYSESAVWKSIDSITGLVLNAPHLRFDKATVLTSIPAYELINIIWREDQNTQYDWTAVGLDKATIITTVVIQKKEYSTSVTPPPHLTKHIERHLSAIDAIRLIKTGVPHLHCHAQFQVSALPISTPLAYCDREGGALLYEKVTELNKSDFTKIKKLWQERMDARSKVSPFRRSSFNALDASRSRFFSAYDYRNWFDSMVDLTIALESLFSPNENEELSHRISLRAAWLLDTNKSGDKARVTKNKTYNLVRTMYKIRSSRVHGEIPKEKKIQQWVATLAGEEYDSNKEMQSFESAMESAREIVRKAIAACQRLSMLGGNGPKWPFPKNFDENIVTPGQRKIWQKAAGIV